jgi:hypothetical protein
MSAAVFIEAAAIAAGVGALGTAFYAIRQAGIAIDLAHHTIDRRSSIASSYADGEVPHHEQQLRIAILAHTRGCRAEVRPDLALEFWKFVKGRTARPVAEVFPGWDEAKIRELQEWFDAQIASNSRAVDWYENSRRKPPGTDPEEPVNA